MTREPQKRERRVAPEFTLVWSAEATNAVNGRSSELVKAVYANAYARIYRAEAALCGAIDIVRIGRVDPIHSFDRWWAPFQVGDLWFVLRYRDTLIREYELLPASGPAPDGGGEPPIITRRQKRAPPKRVAPPPRPRKSGGAKGSRPASAKKHPKQTDAKRMLTILYRLARRRLNATAAELNHSLEQLQSRFKPRLLRSFVRVRRISGNCLNTMRDAVAPFVQTAQEFVTFAVRLKNSFTGISQLPAQTVSRGATLVPRCAGQNTGLNVLVYSWSWDEPPAIDWSQYLFGVDWTVNLFGMPPEEERAF